MFTSKIAALSFALVAWSNIAAALEKCPSEALKKAASLHGYRFIEKGRYCEGLLMQDHAADSLQLFHLMAITDPLIGASALFLNVPTDSAGTVAFVRGASLSSATPYRFDADIIGGQEFTLSFKNIIIPAEIDISSLGFVATKRHQEESYLVPVILSAKPLKQQRWPRDYSIGIRASIPLSEVDLTLLNGSGKVVYQHKLKRRLATGQLVPLPIEGVSGGKYRLQIRASGLDGPKDNDLVLYRLIELP